MRQIEGYLSRVAQSTWPGATVWRDGEDDGESRYTLQRPGEPDIGLGSGGFSEAKQALTALRRAAPGA